MSTSALLLPGHGNRKRFVTGCVLAIMLTALPFWLVMSNALSQGATAMILFVFAIVQIVVHVVFFLHVDARSEGGWTLMASIFTAIIVMLTIVGSIWVMYHLDANMMPMHGTTDGTTDASTRASTHASTDASTDASTHASTDAM